MPRHRSKSRLKAIESASSQLSSMRTTDHISNSGGGKMPDQSDHPRLLDLPAELRNQIDDYHARLHEPDDCWAIRDETFSMPAYICDMLRVQANKTPSLATVCRQSRSEFLPLFRSESPIKLTLPDSHEYAEFSEELSHPHWQPPFRCWPQSTELTIFGWTRIASASNEAPECPQRQQQLLQTTIPYAHCGADYWRTAACSSLDSDFTACTPRSPGARRLTTSAHAASANQRRGKADGLYLVFSKPSYIFSNFQCNVAFGLAPKKLGPLLGSPLGSTDHLLWTFRASWSAWALVLD